MYRSSSLPKYRKYRNELPRISDNSWLTNSSQKSDSYYPQEKNDFSGKLLIKKQDVSYAMNNVNNNYYRKVNGSNTVVYDQLNSIQNNYYQMKDMLNDKMHRLEHNQRKVNDFLKYSLEQDRLQNNMNSLKFNRYIKNYREKNLSEKDYLLNMLNRVPNLISNKIDKIYLNELEENRNQKYFLDNIKERMALELQNQRRYDYLKYKRQLNEVLQLKNNEEKERIRLYHKIQKQKIMYRMQAMKYQNQLYQYQAYNIPFYHRFRRIFR